MILNAGCKIVVETAMPTPVVLMLRPLNGAAQFVQSSSVTFDPSTPSVETTDLFGNNLHRVVLAAGCTIINTAISASVSDHIDVHLSAPFTQVQHLPDSVLQYLLPSRYCQSDLLLDLATSIAGKASPGYGQAAAIRDWIHHNIQYKHGSSGPSTSAVDTSKSRQGVCRDFSHLGIALCRALRIPARIVSGYLYQLDPMDLHAWFEVFVGGRWYTMDATQSEPRGNRIIVAFGRDAADVAQMSEYGKVQVQEMNVYVNAAS
jgi:transglutaminase-like putative cysteine protease